MSLAVIGYTGFVGSTVCRQAAVTDVYNSKNIEEVAGRTFDTVICAGAPGAKWRANQNPDADLENIGRLIACLPSVRVKQFALISTIDVFANPHGVDEATAVDPHLLSPYGSHRYYLELSVRGMFPDALIVRLPGLFGQGLRKNFIYDLINGGNLHLTHSESMFQFYNTEKLWADVRVAIAGGLHLVHFATEPVRAADVARFCFGTEFHNRTESPAANYDMRTRFASTFGGSGAYLYSAEYTFSEIARFADRSRKERIYEHSHLESRLERT